MEIIRLNDISQKNESSSINPQTTAHGTNIDLSNKIKDQVIQLEKFQVFNF